MEITFFLLFIAGFYLGRIYTNWLFMREVKKLAKEQGINLEFEIKEVEQKSLVHKLSVEKHGNMLYLFDKKTDTFICQATSIQELAKLAQSYNNINYAAVIFDNKVFTFHEGEIQEEVQ